MHSCSPGWRCTPALGEGEICGLRLRSWDSEATPLGCLEIDSQYDGQALKTDSDDRVRPRKVPVHPDLARLLKMVDRERFEFVYCRKPRPDDALVPHRGGEPHTRVQRIQALAPHLR